MKSNLINFLFLLLNSALFCQNLKIKDIPVPEKCKRVLYDSGSFSSYIQNLPLKNDNIILTYTNSVLSNNFYNVWGVVDKALLFKSDLEQCADWCMRFWADYHKENLILDKLYLFDYSGKKIFYTKKTDYKEFLKKCFSGSNSYSLKVGCRYITPEDLRPGDMFVQNSTGGIGHVTMVVDVCVDTSGKKYFLIGYSFMPAQQFHIEKASKEFGKDGWFTYEGIISYLKENFNFGEPVLRRF